MARGCTAKMAALDSPAMVQHIIFENFCGVVAQLGERHVRNVEVESSILFDSTTNFSGLPTKDILLLPF